VCSTRPNLLSGGDSDSRRGTDISHISFRSSRLVVPQYHTQYNEISGRDRGEGTVGGYSMSCSGQYGIYGAETSKFIRQK
jgi:hypothetical protein